MCGARRELTRGENTTRISALLVLANKQPTPSREEGLTAVYASGRVGGTGWAAPRLRMVRPRVTDARVMFEDDLGERSLAGFHLDLQKEDLHICCCGSLIYFDSCTLYLS